MRYLLDTNVLIRFLFRTEADADLSPKVEHVLMTAQSLYLSIVSLWEIAIKMKIGKLQIHCSMAELQEACREQGIDILPIRIRALDETLKLQLRGDHKDPFDRLILATALTEHMTLLTSDQKMKGYGVNLIQ